jgi:hypothetical protein
MTAPPAMTDSPDRPAAGAAACLVLAALLGGCSTPPSLAELNASYDRALERTAPLAGRFEPGSPAEREALDRLAGYFDGLTPAKVADQTLSVYDPDAYLNDTLVAIEGAGAIRDYFAATMERAEGLRVRFLEVARPVATGGQPPGIADYYIRWEMTVKSRHLAGGEPVVTYGVSHFRLDPAGQVLIHKDYWDSGTGLYEHLPVLGGLVQWVRAAADAGH